MVGCALSDSSEYLFRRKWHTVATEKRQKLVTKISTAVMFGLISNVGADVVQVGTTHTETAVPLLPSEEVALLVHPLGGVRFQRPHHHRD